MSPCELLPFASIIGIRDPFPSVRARSPWFLLSLAFSTCRLLAGSCEFAIDYSASTTDDMNLVLVAHTPTFRYCFLPASCSIFVCSNVSSLNEIFLRSSPLNATRAEHSLRVRGSWSPGDHALPHDAADSPLARRPAAGRGGGRGGRPASCHWGRKGKEGRGRVRKDEEGPRRSQAVQVGVHHL